MVVLKQLQLVEEVGRMPLVLLLWVQHQEQQVE